MVMDQEAIDRGIDEMRDLLEEDAELRSEFEASRAEFFHASSAWRGRGTAGDRDPLAARRHLEWFLLERFNDRLGTLPAEVLLERGEHRSETLAAERAQSFLGSHCSVFEVTGVEPTRGLWLRDLASHGEYAITERDASQVLRSGDLIVGRVFPVGDSMHHISRAASFFRNPRLLSALRADLDRARDARRGTLRLRQDEIETMFYAAQPGEDASGAIERARGMLLEGGVSSEEFDEILELLASEQYSGESILPGASDTLGEILDRLAFESSVDLESARRALLAAWIELSRSGPGRGASLKVERPDAESPAPANVAEAIAEYERKIKSGHDREGALRDLEQALSLAAGGHDDLEEDTPAPDFPGVVGAMIEEFLWESAQEHGRERADDFACLRSFGRAANTVGVFENLSAEDLLEYACRWLPESGELADADEARRVLSALHAFSRWAEENHGVHLHSGLQSTLHDLQVHVPRIVEANRRRTREAEADRGELFECTSLSADGSATLKDVRDVERTATIASDLVPWLRVGDRLRGHILGDGRLAVYCCYPPEPRRMRASE
jgi:hypothetical protein